MSVLLDTNILLRMSNKLHPMYSAARDAGYFDMRGRLPIADLQSRLSYANKLSAAESPQQPEIILGLGKGSTGFVLFDQQSNFFYEPVQNLSDAIFDEQRKMVVTWQSSAKPGYTTVRLISFE